MLKKMSLPNVFSAILAALAMLVVVSTTAAAQHQHESAGSSDKTSKGITIEGEVIDMYCFMMHPETGQGPDHAKCAKTCMEKGLPIGFLSNGEVYLLIGKEHESVKDLVVDFAGTKSRLTGTPVTHHGVKAIEMSSIEPLASAGGSPAK
jgi:hypothetical protein